MSVMHCTLFSFHYPEQLWSSRDPRTAPLVTLPGHCRPLPIPSPTSADGTTAFGPEHGSFRLSPAKIAVRAGWEFVATIRQQQQQQQQREYDSNWNRCVWLLDVWKTILERSDGNVNRASSIFHAYTYSSSAEDKHKWNDTNNSSKWSKIVEQCYKWNRARSRYLAFIDRMSFLAVLLRRYNSSHVNENFLCRCVGEIEAISN